MPTRKGSDLPRVFPYCYEFCSTPQILKSSRHPRMIGYAKSLLSSANNPGSHQPSTSQSIVGASPAPNESTRTTNNSGQREGKPESKRTRDGGQTKEEEVRNLKHEMERMRKRAGDLEMQLEGSKHERILLEEQLILQADELKAVKDHAHQMMSQHSQIVELLETRTAELSGSQAFLTKADLLSGAEVISMVEALNTEILQLAAFMADSCKFQRRETRQDESKEMQDAYSHATESLGQGIVHLLRSTSHDDDRTPVQIALQACMNILCEHFVKSWCLDAKQNDVLAGVYERIWEAGMRENSSANKCVPDLISATVQNTKPCQADGVH